MDRRAIRRRFDRLAEEVRAYAPKADMELLERAFHQSLAWRGAHKCEHPEAYLLHALDVAGLVARLRMDMNSLVAALLHDVLEFGLAEKRDVEKRFGPETALLVDAVATLSRHRFRSRRRAEQVQSFRKMFLAMAKDIRVLLIKMADRLDLMRHLDRHCEPDDRRHLARETWDIYAALARRLGIRWIQSELEDLSLRELEAEEYVRVADYVEVQRRERQSHVDGMVRDLEELMRENGVQAVVQGRKKSLASILEKMKRKTLDVDQLYDIFAYRIIVKNLEQCYRALGLVHSRWRPISGMFEDYVATPKPNGYQSLHTVVVGSYGERAEVQIRTEEMNDIAENGMAAHWRYKEQGSGRPAGRNEEAHVVPWLRELMAVQHQRENQEEFLDALRLDVFSDYVFVFSPGGDVHEMPLGSTPVDFAFSVHTQVGLHCSGAKVGGQMVPLRHELKNGDVVEILTNKNQHPKKEWLEFAKTNRARNKIRHAIRAEERERSKVIGRELCEREFKRLGLNFNRMAKQGELDRHLSDLKARDLDELFIHLGRGNLTVRHLLKRVAPEKTAELEKAEKPEEPKFVRKGGAKRSRSGLRISGLDDVMVRFAKCCNPIQGDPVVGFITRGRGVTVHRADCRKIPKDERERFIDVDWDLNETCEMPIRIRVVSIDRPGLFAALSAVFTSHGINIISARADSDDEKAIATFLLKVENLAHFDKIRRQLLRVKGVQQVRRMA